MAPGPATRATEDNQPQDPGAIGKEAELVRQMNEVKRQSRHRLSQMPSKTRSIKALDSETEKGSAVQMLSR